MYLRPPPHPHTPASTLHLPFLFVQVGGLDDACFAGPTAHLTELWCPEKHGMGQSLGWHVPLLLVRETSRATEQLV